MSLLPTQTTLTTTVTTILLIKVAGTDPNNRGVKRQDLPPIACWDCRYKFRQWHGCLSLVLLRTGLCDWPITRPEKPYRLWSVTVCDLEASRIRWPWPALGCCARVQNKSLVSDNNKINKHNHDSLSKRSKLYQYEYFAQTGRNIVCCLPYDLACQRY